MVADVFLGDTKIKLDTVDWVDLKVFGIVAPIARKVRAQDVGVNIPGIDWLGLDACPGVGEHKALHNFTNFEVLGHAHICPKDPDKGMICTREAWLTNIDGTYSDTLLHEVAHILTDYGEVDSVKCVSLDAHSWTLNGKTPVDKIYGPDWHGPSWQEWAIKLGTSPLPWGSPPKGKEFI